MKRFIESAREFSALPEDCKEAYGRSEGEMFLGYEKGKERFKNAEGKWVVDDLKVSYYGLIPDSPLNKWPREMDLKSPLSGDRGVDDRDGGCRDAKNRTFRN